MHLNTSSIKLDLNDLLKTYFSLTSGYHKQVEFENQEQM